MVAYHAMACMHNTRCTLSYLIQKCMKLLNENIKMCTQYICHKVETFYLSVKVIIYMFDACICKRRITNQTTE